MSQQDQIKDQEEASPLAEAVERLNRYHDFPGPYMFKAIGDGGPAFEARVRAAVERVLGPLLSTDRVRIRPSSGGKYQSLTLEVQVASAEQVLQIYGNLREVKGMITLF